jgi:hypothetical protein
MDDAAIEKKAEDIVKAMAADSWDGTIEIVANLLREAETARKVADAAVAAEITHSADVKLKQLYPGLSFLLPSEADLDASRELKRANIEARLSLAEAVREYRKLTEPPPLDARIEAEIASGEVKGV